MSGTVLVEQIELGVMDARLGLVTLNRPDALNPIDWDTGLELHRIFGELAAEQCVRVVAVTGAGRAFSAGGDMVKYQQLQRDPVEFPRFLADMHAMLGSISQYPKPYLALINGTAVAGGLELLLSCDLAFAAESARIGDAHLAFGQMGGAGVLTLLPRAVGPARARELILSGRLLDASEALAWGLVSRVISDEALIDAAVEFARGIAAKSPLAVANAKRVLNAALWEGTGVAAAMRLESEATARYCLTSRDAHEGLAAFAQKRPPAFTGR